MRKLFKLKPEDINRSSSGFTSSGRSKLGQSRSLDSRSLELRLKHVPTGVEVAGTIKSGNYSREDMRKRRRELESQLIDALTQAVATHLRVPGR